MQDAEAAASAAPQPQIDVRRLVLSNDSLGLEGSIVPMPQPSQVAQSGDSWAKLAKSYYGDERFAKALAQYNGARSTWLKEGQSVSFPDLSDADLKDGGSWIAKDAKSRADIRAEAVAKEAESYNAQHPGELLKDPVTGQLSFAYSSKIVNQQSAQAQQQAEALPADGWGVGGLFGVKAIQGNPQWIDVVGDSHMRLDFYNARLKDIPPKYRLDSDAPFDQIYENAKAASAERNAVLDETRARISPQGLQWSQELKAEGKSLEQLELHYQGKRKLPEPTEDVFRDIIEGSGRTRASVTIGANVSVGIANGMSVAAKPLAVFASGMDGYSLGTQINQSRDTGNWRNTGREGARIASAWAGAWAGAEAGAAGGAWIGAWTGPAAYIAVPALTLIGGIGGSIVGYWKGGQAGRNVFNYANGGR